MLLQDLHTVWEREIKTQREHTAALARLVNELPPEEEKEFEDAITTQALSVWLARFGIRAEPNPFRLHGRLARGYRRSSFADPFKRYLRV